MYMLTDTQFYASHEVLVNNSENGEIFESGKSVCFLNALYTYSSDQSAVLKLFRTLTSMYGCAVFVYSHITDLAAHRSEKMKID